jgi:hypothetical protein
VPQSYSSIPSHGSDNSIPVATLVVIKALKGKKATGITAAAPNLNNHFLVLFFDSCNFAFSFLIIFLIKIKYMGIKIIRFQRPTTNKITTKSKIGWMIPFKSNGNVFVSNGTIFMIRSIINGVQSSPINTPMPYPTRLPAPQ